MDAANDPKNMDNFLELVLEVDNDEMRNRIMRAGYRQNNSMIVFKYV